MMRGLICLCLLLLLSPASFAQQQGPADEQITDLQQLLQSVRQQRRQQQQINRQREAEFLQDKQSQQSRLNAAKRAFAESEKTNQPLLLATEANAADILKLEKQLADVVENMGDFSSSFSEFAGDFGAVMRESMVSVQFPQRQQQMKELAATESQPEIEEIETLWLLLQEEMTEASRVRKLPLPVVAPDGSSQQQMVWRIGPFSAYSEQGLLRYIPETGELLALSRQPGARQLAVARGFMSAQGELAPAVVDPTRGSLLGMLSYTPSLRERIDQGGIIGLIILALGALGMLITTWRSLALGVTFFKVGSQLREIEQPRDNNPLGRVILEVKDIPLEDEELLQLKLDEAVLTEIPALERGTGLIKLLAATSPLLGLLGTVTGMILTFQAISLFGTGDPKLMAGGISQALITTVLGLVVAIPLLFGHSLVSALSRNLIQRLDEQCAGILARSAESKGKRV